jgi:hypothetical protein
LLFSITSTENPFLMKKFTGYLQEQYIMRMELGGIDDEYLAVSSENG